MWFELFASTSAYHVWQLPETIRCHQDAGLQGWNLQKPSSLFMGSPQQRQGFRGFVVPQYHDATICERIYSGGGFKFQGTLTAPNPVNWCVCCPTIASRSHEVDARPIFVQRQGTGHAPACRCILGAFGKDICNTLMGFSTPVVQKRNVSSECPGAGRSLGRRGAGGSQKQFCLSLSSINPELRFVALL